MSHAKFSRKEMELLVIFPALCLCFSVLLTPCVGIQIQEQVMASRVDEVQFSLPAATLPRKLRVILNEKAAPVNDHKSQGSTSSDILQRGDISGKPYQKEENVLRGSRGTRQEWAEGTDTSQYFTMDYSHVRRRRPIHNKALPVGP
ncbi:protein GOLVEN 6 [Hevea brasiliensis]|uniref:protein GOLVEN 6 n=1 Tax=Hevea brasiliensis TaxID=3981 RepID=UPI0025EE69C9|nr:protein GOLVEN 6 [Hevea brasiliensis]